MFAGSGRLSSFKELYEHSVSPLLSQADAGKISLTDGVALQRGRVFLVFDGAHCSRSKRTSGLELT